MIFYFSGTGNSLWAAKQLSRELNEALIPVADELKKSTSSLSYTLRADEKVIFVFPVHSWGPAIPIARFIKAFTLENYTVQPVYFVCTCGDECGYTDKIISDLLKQKSLHLTAGYSIQMPNNYILMKGFGIDSKEIEKEKLDKAPQALQDIINSIHFLSKEKKLYKTGSFPFIKSRLVYPAFSGFAIGRNSFYATDRCTRCGLCAKICPTNTISIRDNKLPEWNNTCVQCTACIHRCPVRAIEYGKITQKQGRYHHPDLK